MEIIRQHDPLNREVWNFTFAVERIYLITYSKQRRENTRKKTYKMLETYDKHSRNNSLDRADIPLPEDVKEEVLKRYINEIKFII